MFPTTFAIDSICAVRILVPIKSRVSCYSHDHLLDFLRKVCILFIFDYALSFLIHQMLSIGGYISTRAFSSLASSPSGNDWARNVFFTASILPTFIFSFVFLLNLLLIFTNSSGAVPFGTMLVVVLLWFLISAPLTLLGAYYGRKHGVSATFFVSFCGRYIIV